MRECSYIGNGMPDTPNLCASRPFLIKRARQQVIYWNVSTVQPMLTNSLKKGFTITEIIEIPLGSERGFHLKISRYTFLFLCLFLY